MLCSHGQNGLQSYYSVQPLKQLNWPKQAHFGNYMLVLVLVLDLV